MRKNPIKFTHYNEMLFHQFSAHKDRVSQGVVEKLLSTKLLKRYK